MPSGIVTTATSIIQAFFDTMPHVGVITTESVVPSIRAGNRVPVYSQYAPGCFVNAIGLTNPGADAAAADALVDRAQARGGEREARAASRVGPDFSACV